MHYAEGYFYLGVKSYSKSTYLTLLLFFADFNVLNQKQTQDLQSTTHNLIARLAKSLMTNLKKLEKYVSEAVLKTVIGT